MSDSVDLNFLEFLAELGMSPDTPASNAASRDLDEARVLLRESIEAAASPRNQEELFLRAMDVSLAGIRLNDRKMRLLALLTKEALQAQSP